MRRFAQSDRRRFSNPSRLSAPLIAIHGFAYALLAALWLTVTWHLPTERLRIRDETASEAANLTLVFEQNIIRTASELDRILQFLRTSRERHGPQIPWQDLIRENYTINEQAVQIAVIDQHGMMITSTAMLNPKVPVDLSDREHFRFHASATTDGLHISRPMVGRASGKWSIQFTRRLTTADGAFAGVVVISLDPSHLSRVLAELNLGQSGGVAIIGTDDVVRAGIGRFSDALGKGYREGYDSKLINTLTPGTVSRSETIDGRRMIVASRRVSGYPLEIVIAADGVDQNPAWTNLRRTYLTSAVLLTVAIFIAMMAGAFGHRRHERSLLHMAGHDPLTGLANRMRFQECLNAALAKSTTDRLVALYLIDLDAFKAVNDTLGHPIGDKLLKSVAERLRSGSREHDILARLGGDEFALVHKDLGAPASAEAVALRICERLAEPFVIDGQHISIGASVGIALSPIDANSSVDLVRSADLALYCAKLSGRGNFKRYSQSMSDEFNERRKIEEELRVAIQARQFEVFYQPIMCIASRRTIGFEALIRWRHPEHGMIPPTRFISIAEEVGLIAEIGEWVLTQACSDASAWPSDIKVCVNVSARQLANGAFIETVTRTLKHANLNPNRLELEITESMMMQNDGKNARLIEEVRAMGVSIAMDDFGTGYSSLSYLHRFPIDCIKIDRSFLLALEANENSTSIIKAIIALAEALGMRTVVEGVESQSQLDLMAGLGCTEAQGYFVGRPAPMQAATDRILEARRLELVAA